MKIVAITQARYGSTRLPAKILKQVKDKTLLEIHLIRILKSRKIDKLIVATTNEEGAGFIIDVANKLDVPCYQGSVTDVLDRFYNAAIGEHPDYVVRLTSDCPLIDPEVIDKVITSCVESNSDYACNTLPPTYPDGVDVEVFKFEALAEAWKEAKLQSEREHVTPYIWKNSTLFKNNVFQAVNVPNATDLSSIRMTVDTIEDFQVIEELILNLGYDKPFGEYVEYLDKHMEIKSINQSNKRNEGYSKSLLND